MTDPHLTPEALSLYVDRKVAVKTLANWRCDDEPKGPVYRRIGNRIYYPLSKVHEWLAAIEHGSTREYGGRREALAGRT